MIQQRDIQKATNLSGVLAALWLAALPCHGQTKPVMRMEDRARIGEAINISRLFGEKIWAGFDKAPFALVLMSDSVEFLINHPLPSADFTLLGHDSVLSTQVYYRAAVFPRNLLATFPAVNGVNTIVVGTPENTGTNSTSWITSLLHEHFHQYVYSSPGYYESVAALGLSGEDQSGMWMLNYPFPYTDRKVARQYGKYTRALAAVVSSIGRRSFDSRLRTYVAERKRFQGLLKRADFRYFSFQIWQEGIARYTEYKFLQLLVAYVPSKEVSELPDFTPFGKYRGKLIETQLHRLVRWTLPEHKRDCFYAVGLAEGLLLDALEPDWREKYLSEKFSVERYSRRIGGQIKDGSRRVKK